MFQPTEMANNLKEHGSFVPGIRPGAQDGRVPRARHDPHHARRRDLPGGHRDRPAAGRAARRRRRARRSPSFLGGTSILIVVGVALDLVDKLNASSSCATTRASSKRRPAVRRAGSRSACGLVLLGPPGAGKGTQAAALASARGLAARLDRRPAPRRRRGRHAARAAARSASWTRASSSPTTLVVGLVTRADRRAGRGERASSSTASRARSRRPTALDAGARRRGHRPRRPLRARRRRDRRDARSARGRADDTRARHPQAPARLPRARPQPLVGALPRARHPPRGRRASGTIDDVEVARAALARPRRSGARRRPGAVR